VTYAETMAQLTERRAELMRLQGEMRALQAAVEPQPVEDCTFEGWGGPVRLSALFGGRRDLLVIHNMGRGCSHCTMWADGFNGVYQHLANRAAFVMVNPDPVETQRAFAGDRGWRFPMVSYGDSGFGEAMGYRRADVPDEYNSRGFEPGVSALRRDEDGRIWRVSDTDFGPGDQFCAVWPLLDLFPEGADGWSPKFRYA